MSAKDPGDQASTPKMGTFDPIAIVGYGYRLPGGIEDDESLYQLFANRQFVQELIDQRYGKGEVPWDGFTSSPTCVASPYEGLITDGRELEFDCALFGVSKNDAKRMDPQIKMMLSATWDALQCAGLDQAALHNSNTGVYIGQQIPAIASWKNPHGCEPPDVPGRSAAMISNRISYHFNWKGPSMSVATACSSGITALDMATKALHNGECDVATFGAVTYLGQVGGSVAFNALGIISKTGSSRSFDKDANGYMRSEGAFVFILKRLSDAERDGDNIFGVIRGCGLNTAGAEPDAQKMTPGRMIVAPVQQTQTELMKRVAEMAAVDPSAMDYVEAHATGTVIGDAVEGNAIAEAYGASDRVYPLRVASARSNLGHMEAASFTSSLLKVIVMLQRQEFLPISSHFHEHNPEIPFLERNMRVQTSVESFPDDDRVVIIGINSFGFGGSNGHCIVEQYKPPTTTSWSSLTRSIVGKQFFVPLSAKSDEALKENARNLAKQLLHMEEQWALDMYTLTANLSTRMTHHRVRKGFVASGLEELQDQLVTFSENSDECQNTAEIQHTSTKRGLNIVMVFPGQGSQWAGCGKELYETEPRFREVVHAIDEQWLHLSGHVLSEVVFDKTKGEELDECQWAQPATFLVQVGMYEMLKFYGVKANAVVGHSAGEVAAAYASGAYTLEESCFLVYHRSKLQQTLAGSGRMLVLMMDYDGVCDKLEKYSLTSDIEVACLNSPMNTVVSGSSQAIKSMQAGLEKEGLPQGKLIPGNTAFHSRHMDPIESSLLDVLDDLHRRGPRGCQVPMISTVTGSFQGMLPLEYWWYNVRKPVNLKGAMETVAQRVEPDVLIELSPHITLRSPIRDFYSERSKKMPTYIYSAVRDENSALSLHRSLCRCFESGVELDFKKLYGRPKPVTNLFPPYFMRRERVIDDLLDEGALIKHESHSDGPMLGTRHRSRNLLFEAVYGKGIYPWMEDHKVQGKSIIPAAGYVELILEAFQGEPVRIIESTIVAPFVLSGKARMVHTELQPLSHAPDEYEFTVTSFAASDPTSTTKHFVGVVEKLNPLRIASLLPPGSILTLDSVEDNEMETIYHNADEFYSLLEARVGDAFGYQSHFRTLQKVHRHPETLTSRFEIEIDAAKFQAWDKMGYIFHPALLDGVLQSYIEALLDSPDFSGVPKMLKNFVFIRKPSSEKILSVLIPSDVRTHQKGQLSFKLGDSDSGTVFVYDAVTLELIAFAGEYYTFLTNDKRSDLKRLRHFLSWQPKGGSNMDSISKSAIKALCSGGSLDGALCRLIDLFVNKVHPCPDTPFFLNMAECIIGPTPPFLILEKCIEHLIDKPVQFSLLSSDSAFRLKKYKEIGIRNQDANIRFFNIEAPTNESFLRPSMFELLVIRVNSADQEQNEEVSGKLLVASKLVAPGGIVLVELAGGASFDIPTCWSLLGTTPDKPSDVHSNELTHRIFILQASDIQPIAETSLVIHAREWVVVDDCIGFSLFWSQYMKRKENAPVEFEESHRWSRVDYFAMAEDEANTANLLHYAGAAKLTEFVQQIAARRSAAEDKTTCLFTVFTSGAVCWQGDEDHRASCSLVSPIQTAIWGTVRSLAAELSESCKIEFRLIDVAEQEDLKLVLGVEDMRERELCIHGGLLSTSRLINIREVMPRRQADRADGPFYRLHTDCTGSLRDLEFRTYEPPTLEPNFVEILVEAAALNFRDIMVSLGKLPALSYERSSLGRQVGMECAGTVVRCGEEVSHLQVGDEVIALQGGCIGNRVRTDCSFVFRKPNTLSMEEGSSVVSVYTTAYYALCYLARMRKGQTILVHSGMGGVGQAAIALAKVYGVHVYSTAGSEDRRSALRSMGCLGAFDSHSTSWYGDLMEATGGKGVDIVLNSLAGKHIDLCLEALSPGGWHCEIGKMDIYSDRPLKMAVFRKNICYRAIDIDRLMLDDPDVALEVIRCVLDLLKSNEVPALRLTVFPYSKYMDAVTLMMKGLHSGKLVLKPDKEITVIDNQQLFSSTDRTVLLSGCFGGLGNRLLAYVIAMGAKHILMLDRDKERRRSANHLLHRSGANFLLGKTAKDVEINIVHADVRIYEDVVFAVESIQRLGMPPLGSVFHLAGVLDDKPCSEIDRSSFEKVFSPKADGAWNLHRATLHCDVEHFVMLSSIASAFGNPGQVNYSAANAYLDGLAAQRGQVGLPALSFMMGAVSDTGMAARNPKLLSLMKAKGLPAFSSIFAFETLDWALRSQKHSNVVAALATGLVPDFASSDFLRSWAQLIRNSAAFESGGSGDLSMNDIMQMIASRVGSLCGEDNVQNDEPFASYGLNSISVAELITFLKLELTYNITAMELITTATCRSIAEGIVSERESREQGARDKTNSLTDHNNGQNGNGTTNGEYHEEGTSRPFLQVQLTDIIHQEVVDVIIRPPRSRYQVDALGPRRFTFCDREFTRSDCELATDRGYKLVCSHWEPTERPQTAMPVLLYLHGANGARDEVISQLSYLLPIGVTVFAFDFAGSGLSEGDYVTQGAGEQEDIATVTSYLQSMGSVSSVVLWGRCLGASVALMYCAREHHSISGLVVDSPYSDLVRLTEEVIEDAKVKSRASWSQSDVTEMLERVFDTVVKQAGFHPKKLSPPVGLVERCFVPALFLVGEHDAFIRKQHSEDIVERYGGETSLLVFDGDHFSTRPDHVLQQVTRSIQSYLHLQPSDVLFDVPASLSRNEPPWAANT